MISQKATELVKVAVLGLADFTSLSHLGISALSVSLQPPKKLGEFSMQMQDIVHMRTAFGEEVF